MTGVGPRPRHMTMRRRKPTVRKPGVRRPSARVQGEKEAGKRRAIAAAAGRSGRTQAKPSRRPAKPRRKTPLTMQRGGRLTATEAEARGHPPSRPRRKRTQEAAAPGEVAAGKPRRNAPEPGHATGRDR